ncbi:DNA repair protein [Marinobacter sp. JSM 1782161]|uniref:DNA repair protein n=1 Tax=Marinobacter sp. JSM 1782161 TaxID=2685906 RepID=UPI00140240E6|nr:DNA repair protein [Marinobacter sp. JSM 1782161]
MAKPAAADEGYSAVFLMDGPAVSRQMRGSEFGAFLDGYVGLSDLADTDVRAVYINLAPDLGILGLVFFRIYFDEEGRADSHWNIPVERFAVQGPHGPDLGAGPIHLVCRSRCPEPRYADELWDPDMTPGSNHFQAIRRAVQENRLKFQKRAPAVADEDIPVLTPAQRGGKSAEERKAAQQRVRLARTIREQRLRIKTLQSVHRDAMSDMQREHRHEVQGLRNELRTFEEKLERQRLANEQLKARLTERNEQYLNLQQELSEAGEQESAGSEASDAEVVLLREQLDRKQRELALRNERIIALEQECEDLSRQEPAEQSLMAELKQQTVFLVAYHAGLGHTTLPYEDIARYFENPTAYVAEKCGLNEPAYRQWLAHHDSPSCQADVDGHVCGEPLIRVGQPADFRPGVDDRCPAHQEG